VKRNISIEMEYRDNLPCKLSKEERDEMFLIICRIVRSYICDDHETKMSIADEYGKETVDL
jgi:hypothetical protein